MFTSMERNVRFLGVRRVGEGTDDEAYLTLTPAERIGLIWPLTVDAWTLSAAARGETFDAQSRLQRDHISVQRSSR